MGNRRVMARVLPMIVFVGLFLSVLVYAQEAPKIVVIKSLDIVPYKQAFSGFNKEFANRKIKPIYYEYNLEGDGEGANKSKIVNEIKSISPTLILTLGSGATNFAKENFKNVPVVFSMVLNPVASGIVSSLQSPGENITGAAMDIPIKEQFEIIKGAISRLGRIIVLYNPEETQAVISRAREVAQEMGIVLTPIPVSSEKDVVESLKKLTSDKDVLWAVADSVVYTPQNTQYIILETLRKGIPFMGISDSFVRAGALIALSCDYIDVGAQTADIAIKILDGQLPSAIPVSLPQKIQLSINMNTAKHINIQLPDSILKKAANIF